MSDASATSSSSSSSQPAVSPHRPPPNPHSDEDAKIDNTLVDGVQDKDITGVDGTGKKLYWFSNIQRKLTPADPAMEQFIEFITNPTDPKAPAPHNLSPIPQVGMPPGGLMVQGPHELASPAFQPAPLMLAEEVIKPPKVLSEIELLMKAWSEEFARAYFVFTIALRFLISLFTACLMYFYYRTVVKIERIRRGTDHQPKNLRVGNVVYFDMEEDGRPMGRIVIGLLTENCPLYCEYFHRRCTGNGGSGNTFRGMRLKCMAPSSAIIFGDGKNMTHDVPGFNPRYLPTEYLAPGAWRGCLCSVPYRTNEESPNFAVMMNAGDFTPNCFGIVMAGFDVLEKIAAGGITHGCEPRKEIVVEGCGELCTLDKSAVQPMPWALYESVSVGYDADKFGVKSSWKTLVEGLGMTKEKLANRSWITKLMDN